MLVCFLGKTLFILPLLANDADDAHDDDDAIQCF